MHPRKLLRRVLSGSYENVRFRDFQRLVEECGFVLDRITGSHHIYSHPGVPVNLNIQNVAGQAKPHQVRQFRRLLERYDLLSKGHE